MLGMVQERSTHGRGSGTVDIRVRVGIIDRSGEPSVDRVFSYYSRERGSWIRIPIPQAIKHRSGSVEAVLKVPEGAVVREVRFGRRGVRGVRYYIAGRDGLRRARRVAEKTIDVAGFGDSLFLRRLAVDLGGVEVPENIYYVERRKIGASGVVRSIYPSRERAVEEFIRARTLLEKNIYIYADPEDVESRCLELINRYTAFIHGYTGVFMPDILLTFKINASPPGWDTATVRKLRNHLGMLIGRAYGYEYVEVPLWKLSIPQLLHLFRERIYPFLSNRAVILSIIERTVKAVSRITLPAVGGVAEREAVDPSSIEIYALYGDGVAIYSVGGGELKSTVIDGVREVIDKSRFHSL